MGAFDWKVIVDNFSFLMRGLGMTFQLAIIATIGGLVLGTLVGMSRFGVASDDPDKIPTQTSHA